MTSDPGFDQRVNRSISLVRGMLEEYRLDEAALLLFNLHKLHLDEWLVVKESLLNTSLSSSHLATIFILIHCSSSSSLFGWDHLVPGLSRFSAHDYPTELFD